MAYCKYVGELVTLARQQSNNVDYSNTNGNAQNLFVHYANEAQDHLQSAIINVYPQEFITEYIVTHTAGSESLSIPEDIFANNRLISVEWSQTGQVRDYWKLRQKTFEERDTRQSSGPSYYIRAGNVIYLNPIPQNSGSVRILYYRELDDVALRLTGTVNGTPSGTSIVLSTPSSDDDTAIAAAEYLCISDRFGNVLLRNGIVSSYNTGSDTITLAANVSTYLTTGYALADLAGKYVTLGRYTTTHSKLPRICERYLIRYMSKSGLSKDANQMSVAEDAEMLRMEQDIIETFAQATEDPQGIPIIDRGILW